LLAAGGIIRAVTDVTTAITRIASASARLDHIGIAVRSIAQVSALYRSLGLTVTEIETVAHEQVRVAMAGSGETRIELLEPASDDSTIGRFLAKRGEGLHHIAVQVPDLDAEFARLNREGARLASTSIGIGASGRRYFFIHPASTGGVLLELVEAQPEPRPA
jgi:LAO/AO transport system kinase